MNRKKIEQIIRFDGRNVFVEVTNAFDIGKLHFNFIEYNLNLPQKSRQTKNISIYLDIHEAATLCTKIITGRIHKEANDKKREQQEKGYKYCLPVYKNIGGVSSETLARRGKSRPDGKAISRQLKITPGDKMPWVLSGEFGPGEEEENKLIKPAYNISQGQKNGQPEGIVRVGLTDDDFLKFGVVLKMSIENFYLNLNLNSNIQNQNKIIGEKMMEIFGIVGNFNADDFNNRSKKEQLKILYPFIKDTYNNTKG